MSDFDEIRRGDTILRIPKTAGWFGKTPPSTISFTPKAFDDALKNYLFYAVRTVMEREGFKQPPYLQGVSQIIQAHAQQINGLANSLANSLNATFNPQGQQIENPRNPARHPQEENAQPQAENESENKAPQNNTGGGLKF